MWNYLTRDWLAERSTRAGIVGIVLSLIGIGVSFAIDPARWGDVAQVIRDISVPLLVAGIAGVLYPGRGK